MVFATNLIIIYNSTILNILYEKLLAAKVPKSVVEKFIGISPPIDLLEDNDDVQNVFGNYELSDEIYENMKDM